MHVVPLLSFYKNSNINVRKYCNIDLSNYKKISKYSVFNIVDNIIYVYDEQTKLFGVEYTDSNIKIEPKYESISHEYDGIFVVKEKNKYGIINLKGDYIVKPIYRYISNKKNGYFLIEDEEYKYGVIDSVGNVVVNPKYKEISVTKYGFIVCEGVKKNGFIGFNGKIIIPLKYSNVVLEKFGLISLSKYKNNSFLYGLKDVNGNTILKCKYDDITIITKDKYLVHRENKVFIYLRDGKKIMNLDSRLYYDVCDSVVRVMNYHLGHISSCVSIIDCENMNVVENKFDYISPFKNGLAIVSNNYKYGIINNLGSLVIDTIYDDIRITKDYIEATKNGVKGYIIDNKFVEKEKTFFDNYNVILRISDNLVLANSKLKSSVFISSDGTINNTGYLYDSATIKHNFIICHNDSCNALYTKDGNLIIPPTKKNIYVIDDSCVVIDGYKIDLSQEYLNFKLSYELDIQLRKKTITKSFDNYDLREKYIEEIFNYEFNVKNKIIELENELERLRELNLSDISLSVDEKFKKYIKNK